MSAFIQKATGRFSNGATSDATATATLAGVVAGNSIIAVIRGGSYNYASAPTCSVTDGTTFSLSARSQGDAGSNIRPLAEIHFRHAVGAGSHVVIATMSAGAYNAYGDLDVLEVSGLQDTAADVISIATDGTDTPDTGTTFVTAQDAEFAIAVVGVLGSGTISLSASGYTNGYVDTNLNADSVGGSSDYKALSVIGTQSANWGVMGAGKPWAAAIATFKDVSGFTVAPGAGLVTIAGRAPVAESILAIAPALGLISMFALQVALLDPVRTPGLGAVTVQGLQPNITDPVAPTARPGVRTGSSSARGCDAHARRCGAGSAEDPRDRPATEYLRGKFQRARADPDPGLDPGPGYRVRNPGR
jgi:hypothetical protein